MSIFNPEKGKNDKQNISLDDYERRLDERRAEYERLNEILRGMRSEVSKLMDEIKIATDELVKKNSEKFLIEQKIEDLNRNYELLEQNVKYEQENFDRLTIELEKIKNEIRENLIYSDKLRAIKSEYDTVSEQLSIEKIELEKIIDDNTFLIDEEINQLKGEQEDLSEKGKKICKALTKNGSKCKKPAIEGSDYCSAHSAKNSKKDKK